MIKSHKELAKHIEGKAVLHLNSLGKDSAVVLEWLVKYAKPKRIVSLYFKAMTDYPHDRAYMRYQKQRYPNVEFVEEVNGLELGSIWYCWQSPIDIMLEFNHWGHNAFSMDLLSKEAMKKYGCDFIASGQSKYESVARSVGFYKNGLTKGDYIYPLGLMKKAEVISVIKAGIKLHPVYKLNPSTIDFPSYYKMRSTFITDPAYKKRVYNLYPLMRLDEYRYEVLLKEKK